MNRLLLVVLSVISLPAFCSQQSPSFADLEKQIKEKKHKNEKNQQRKTEGYGKGSGPSEIKHDYVVIGNKRYKREVVAGKNYVLIKGERFPYMTVDGKNFIAIAQDSDDSDDDSIAATATMMKQDKSSAAGNW